MYNRDKQKLRSKIYSPDVKLVDNVDCYSIEYDKIYYLVGRFIGNALNQVEPQVKENGNQDFDIGRDLIK